MRAPALAGERCAAGGVFRVERLEALRGSPGRTQACELLDGRFKFLVLPLLEVVFTLFLFLCCSNRVF